MADVRVNRQQPQSSQHQGTQRESGLARRGEGYLPGFRPLGPREFFSMSPFELMRRFTEDMDRFFQAPARGGEEMAWSPSVEVREKDNQLIVCADLPGLKQEDVKIEVNEDGLVIQGERKREHEEKQEGFYRSERSYGRFYRLIPLPEDANVEQAKAQFNNGVLEVTIPVPESQRRRREIPIQTEARTRSSGGGA